MTRIMSSAFALSLALAASLLLATPGSPRSSTSPKPVAQSSSQSNGKPPTAGTDRATLRASTHLVQVNVIAQDKKGNPITDLKQGDFEIFDQGKQQTISVFSMESNHVQPPPASLPPPGVYTNRAEARPGAPTSITVILIDMLNAQFSDMAYAREQLEKFVKTLRPGDRVALYGLTTQLTVLQDFTNNSESLLETIQRTKNLESVQTAASDYQPTNLGSGTEPADAGTIASGDILNAMGAQSDALDAFLNKASQSSADFYTVNRAYITAKALEAIATHIAHFPGRKNLVWVSSGFPIQIAMNEIDQKSTRNNQDFTQEIEHAARALIDSNTAVYPVDARGLIGMPATVSAAAQTQRVTPRTISALPIPVPDQDILTTMDTIADRTGGRAYHNTNDIQNSVRQAIDDSRVTYVLGYYPDHGQWNGKFREIKIKLNRPDSNIRYRRGYFAVDDAPADPLKDAVLLRAVVQSPLDASSLGITVGTTAIDVPGALVLKTNMTIQPSDFVLNVQGDHWVGAIDFLFAQIGDNDTVIVSDTPRMDLNLTQSQYQQLSQEGLVLGEDFRIAPTAKQLRIVARDSISGATGSVTLPLLKLFPSLAAK